MPRWMSAIATASGAMRDSNPAGPSASLRISCAPSTRKPSSANTLTTAASRPSSPAKAARPIRARMRAPSASGRRSSSDGRRTGPTSTRSLQPCSRNAARIRRRQGCGSTRAARGQHGGVGEAFQADRNTGVRRHLPRRRPGPAGDRHPPEYQVDRDSCAARFPAFPAQRGREWTGVTPPGSARDGSAHR